MKPFPKAVKRKLQKKPVQCLANKGAVGSHATPQGQYCRAFLGLPLFLALSYDCLCTNKFLIHIQKNNK